MIDFESLLPIYRKLPPNEGQEIDLLIGNSQILDATILLKSNENAQYDSGIAVLSNNLDLQIGVTIRLRIDQPKASLGYLADDFSDYLKRRKSKIKEREFFLKDCKYYSGDKNPPLAVIYYRSTLSLVRLLTNICHYLDKDAESLIFYKDGKFEIPVDYAIEGIEKICLESLDKLEEIARDKIHHTQKIELLARTVVDIASAIPEQDRFSHLIGNLPEVLAKFQIAYNLFSADFTYEKARDEIHKFKLDIIGRLHKAISDIQTQLLGIPIATFIALTQIKPSNSLDHQFATNTVIFFGILVFCALLAGLVLNQWLTVSSIEGEVKRQNKIFKDRFSSTPEAYEDAFTEICRRVGFQFLALVLVLILIALVIIVSAIFYLNYTKPVFEVFF
jgi:hypothetical protein